MNAEETLEQIRAFAGETFEIELTQTLGSAWAHVPEGTTRIRFYEDIEWLKETVLEYYEDYLAELEDFVDHHHWAHPTISPFATVGGAMGDGPDMFFSDSFAFLFFDSENGAVLSATTDDWDFETLKFEDLGLPTA